MEERRAVDTKIDVLTERVNTWITSTEDYRKSLCAKLDTINNRLNELPCKGSAEERKGMNEKIGLLQKGAMAVIGCLFLGGVWVGNINTTTNQHDKRIGSLESIEQEAQKIRSTNVSKISELEKAVANERSVR